VNRLMREPSFLSSNKQNSQQPNDRGGEKKVMKKSLSLILAIAMVFSMFASVAFAAEVTPATAAEKLVTAGVIKGDAKGDVMADSKWSRQDVVVLLSRLLGKEDVAKATAKSHTFADVTNKFYDGYLSWAVENKYFTGHSATKFGYGEEITVQQFAAVMLRALGMTVEYKDVPAKAAELGLVAANADMNKAATRGEFFVIIDKALTTEYAEGKTLGATLGLKGYEAPVQAVDAKVVGVKKVEVTFANAVDTAKATFALKKGSNTANIADVSWNSAKTVATISFAAKLTKGEYALTVGGVVDSFTKNFTLEDEKVAKIEFTSDKAPIVRQSNTVDPNTRVTVGYKVLNQYGEEVTTNKTVTASVGLAGVTVNNVALTNGTTTVNTGSLEIAKPANSFFNLNDQFSVSLVYTDSSNGNSAFANQIFTVSPVARISTVETLKLYNADKTVLSTKVTDPTTFFVLLNAKDQYGNTITNTTAAGQDLIANAIGTSVALGTVTTVQVSGDATLADGTYLAYPLALPANASALSAGKTTVVVMSNTTGKQGTLEVEVKATAQVAEFTLTAPDVIVAGEKNEFGFEATDEYGNAITDAATLNSASAWKTPLSFVANGVTVDSFNFVQDYVNNKAKLVLDLTSATGDIDKDKSVTGFVSGITNSFKTVQLTVSVKAAAYPVQITNLNDIVRAVAIGGKSAFDGKDDVKLLDNYGRSKDLSNFSTYDVELSTTATNIAIAGYQVTGLTKGSATVSAKLVDPSSNVIDDSAYSFNVRVVEFADIKDYEVADVAKLYTATGVNQNGTNYAKSVSVTGLLADGTKVALPVNGTYTSGGTTIKYYSVDAATAISYNTTTGKLYTTGDTFTDLGDKSEKTYNVTVVGHLASGADKIVTKEVKASNAAPEATTLSLQSAGRATKESDGVISISKAALANGVTFKVIAMGAVKAVDQYGVEIDAYDSTTPLGEGNGKKVKQAYASNFTSTSRTALTGTGAVNAGDTFNMTVVAESGKTISFKVVVKQ